VRNPIVSTIAPAIARRLNELWYSNARPPRLLRAAAAVYARIVRSRLVRPVARPPCPVIVVGNLVAGGSGKTPVVAALAESLADDGFAVSIISRGYGGKRGGEPVRVGPDSLAGRVGDEALELFDRTGRPVWVCRRRAAALEAAHADGADVVLSDDGLQHVRLPRSLEICVIDARRGFGNGFCLPAGPLRQPVARLKTVDMVLVKRAGDPYADDDGAGADDNGAGDGRTRDNASGAVPGTPFRLERGRLRALQYGRPPPEPPAAIDALAGIADPESFFEMLSAMGFGVRRYPLVDHQPITPAMLDELPGPVIMTEKDAARLPQSLVNDRRNAIFVLPVRAALPNAVLQRVTGHVREFRR